MNTDASPLFKVVAFAIAALTGITLTAGYARAADVAIALSAPMTGPDASLSDPIVKGYKLAIKTANAEAGLPGKVLENIQDDQDQPQIGTAVAHKLCGDDRVIGVVGNLPSSMVLSSAPIYSGCDIAQISPEASNDLLSTHGWKTFFRTSSKNSDEAAAGVLWIRKNWPQIKTIATVDFNDSGTRDQGRAFASEWTKAGGTVVDQAHMTAGAGDYRGAITGVIAKQPQLIIVCAFDTDGGLLVKQIRELGFKGSLFGADGVSTPNFIKVAGAGNAEGFYLTNFGYEPAKIPSAARFTAAYQAAYGEAPSAAAANAYDATMVLIHAWKAAGSSERKKVLAGVTHNDYPGLYGPVRFTTSGDLAAPQIGIYGVKAGNFEFVAKAD